MTDAEIVVGLRALSEKFGRSTQVFLWARNQDRVALVEAAIARIQDCADGEWDGEPAVPSSDPDDFQITYS